MSVISSYVGGLQWLIYVVMKMLSWNIRGVEKPEKKRQIKKLLFDRKINMVLLQETKLSSISEVEVRRLWHRDRFEYMSVEAEGRAGGLLCIWNPEVFYLSECCRNKKFILLSGTFHKSFECAILNIYAPNDVVKRGNLWEILLNLKSNFSKPWCLSGDFNEIRNVAERVEYLRRDRGMKDFNEFIDRCEVTEIQMLGKKYT
ncbi:uncharacterized protein LOC114306583 [Camellia sinensis]|uniref:uncharacterized protein LOC114306583 n=1 Tax=Camellia sinensis TaxID=4442 RepID=UPI001036E7D2|nr:uncharacterized protein LOC114306583 [Camellia sinensis]